MGQLARLGLLGTLVSLGIGALAWWSADAWRLRRLSPAVAVATVYQRLYRYGKRLGVPVRAGDTPYEFATGLTERVTELAQERPVDVGLPIAFQQVRWLTELYVRGLYSLREPDIAEKAQALQMWKRLRRSLWRAWVMRNMPKLRR